MTTLPPLPDRILVTGGAGFVGSHIVRGLVARGVSHVRVLDDLFTGNWDNLPDDPAIEKVEGSVCDADSVREHVGWAETVFHLAARNIIASTSDPRNDYETNIGGTLNVLLAARDLGVRKVVYSSSASVYGNPGTLPISEDEGLWTLSPYAVSKLAGENYCVSFFESYDVPTACLRYSNVFGPGQDPRNPYCGVISRFIQRAMNGEPLLIHGDGEQTRDFTFIDDCVDATIRAGQSPRATGHVFNVATGVETSVNRVAGLVADIFDHDVEIHYVERRDIDNIRRRVLNVERIRRALRWTPSHTFGEGLRKTIDWFRAGTP